MTDNEIIKAFDILDKLEFFGGQRAGRELWFNKPTDIQDKDIGCFLRDLDFIRQFINRQKEEMERLKDMVSENDGVLPQYENLIKSEAIKEFAERLKNRICNIPQHHFTLAEVEYYIDNLTKEMTEEKTANMNDYSEQFDKERKCRVEVSRYKYGPARQNFGSGRVDAIATAERCIEAFKRDHNTEHLVDAANYLMFRYMFPMPGEFFKATDSSGSVGTVGTPVNME